MGQLEGQLVPGEFGNVPLLAGAVPEGRGKMPEGTGVDEEASIWLLDEALGDVPTGPTVVLFDKDMAAVPVDETTVEAEAIGMVEYE